MKRLFILIGMVLIVNCYSFDSFTGRYYNKTVNQYAFFDEEKSLFYNVDLEVELKINYLLSFENYSIYTIYEVMQLTFLETTSGDQLLIISGGELGRDIVVWEKIKE